MQSVANMVKGMGSPAYAEATAGKGGREVDSRESLVVRQNTSDSNKKPGKEYAFKIFCSNKDLDGRILKNVEFDKWVRYSGNTEVWYSSSKTILQVLKKEIKKEAPACLFIMGIYSWQYNFKPILYCGGVKKIISVRGMLHPGALSQKSFKKRIYLSLWKLLGLHNPTSLKLRRGTANVFHATDEQEKGYIQYVFGPRTRVMVAANFPHVLAQQTVIEKKVGGLKMVSIGLISPMKNISLVIEALIASGEWGLPAEALAKEGVASGGERVVSHESGLPSVASAKEGVGLAHRSPESIRDEGGSLERRVSHIEYNIYGPVKDKGYWEECEAMIKKLPANVKVNYHGDIHPDKIAETLAQNHVFILPSKSENFGHAIYEALSAGRPVITSHHTPWNNLQDSHAGINISTDNTGELQNAIEFFIAMGQEELKKWSDGAREYSLLKVNLEETRRQYDVMFDP